MKNIVKKTKSKSGENSFFSVIQRIGKAFFLPISVLPIAGILLGLGGSFTNQTTVASYNLQWLLGEGTILAKVGSAIFDNLPLIFALAIALSMAKREKAVAVLSSAIAFIVMHVTINAMLILNGYILADGTFSKKVLSGSV